MKNDSVKYLTPDNLYEQIQKFTSGMAVTRDKFQLVIPRCKLEDMEWNHMDQMHRFSVHNTYEKGIRIATGRDFAVSLTQWGKWPLFISVSDVYVAKGLFYQTLTIAGIFVLHSIITMEEVETDSIKLTDEWFIASHKIFRFMHSILNKKLHVLNTRLQKEDEELRQGRFLLRQKGYHFKTDEPDYCNSNRLSANTIYPEMDNNAFISLENITLDANLVEADNLEFIVKKTNNDTYHIWPAVCPHEGGPLQKGEHCAGQIACPWHGLRFSAVQLSAATPQGSRYGFEYKLMENKIFISRKTSVAHETPESLAEMA